MRLHYRLLFAKAGPIFRCANSDLKSPMTPITKDEVFKRVRPLNGPSLRSCSLNKRSQLLLAYSGTYSAEFFISDGDIQHSLTLGEMTEPRHQLTYEDSFLIYQPLAYVPELLMIYVDIHVVMSIPNRCQYGKPYVSAYNTALKSIRVSPIAKAISNGAQFVKERHLPILAQLLIGLYLSGVRTATGGRLRSAFFCWGSCYYY